MKNLLRMFAVAVLTCVFAASVCAGDMSAPGVAPTPPPQPASSTTGGIVEAITTLLQGLLALL